jgi:proline dehydrogenase
MSSLKTALLNLIPDPMVVFFSRPYVAGNSMKAAIDLADRIYKEKGILSTIDVLGEEVQNEADSKRALDLYLKTIDALGNRKHASVSFKPGHMGYYISKDFCRKNIETICKAGYEKGLEITIDMEDTDQTDFTLQVYREMVEKYPGTGTVLQARLWRTNADIDLLDGITATVRLCIGIYEVPRYVYKTKPAMKENLLALMKKLFDKGHVVQIATHDETIVRRAVDYIEEWKIPKERFEFQMLLGVPRGRLIGELRAKGYDVRLYIPFCERWKDGIHYLRRRLNGNPNFIIYVMKNIMRGSI